MTNLQQATDAAKDGDTVVLHADGSAEVLGDTCNTCRYFRPDKEPMRALDDPDIAVLYGICRRFPAIQSTVSHEWCGEHSRREAA